MEIKGIAPLDQHFLSLLDHTLDGIPISRSIRAEIVEQNERDRLAIAQLEDNISKRAAIIAPIRRIPDDLLVDIFKYHSLQEVDVNAAYSQRFNKFYYPQSFKGTLVLSEVCRRWNRVILHTPGLWSKYYFVGYHLRTKYFRTAGNGSIQLADMLERCLSRSQSTSLDIVLRDFKPGCPVFDILMDKLLPHVKRCQRLRWSAHNVSDHSLRLGSELQGSTDLREFMWEIDNTSVSRKSSATDLLLPSLQKVQLRTMDYDILGFKLQASALSEMTLGHISLIFPSICALLVASPCLARLDIEHCRFSEKIESTVLPSISLPLMRHLAVSGLDRGLPVLCSVLTTWCRNLRCLHAKIDILDLEEVLPLKLLMLRALALQIFHHCKITPDGVIDLLSDIPNLQDLRLHQVCHTPGDGETFLRQLLRASSSSKKLLCPHLSFLKFSGFTVQSSLKLELQQERSPFAETLATFPFGPNHYKQVVLHAPCYANLSDSEGTPNHPGLVVM